MIKRILFLAVVGALIPSAAFAQTIPAGTIVHCRLMQTLSTRVNYPSDAFTAGISEPVMLNGRTVIPVGATLMGRVATLRRPGRVKGVGEMRLLADKIVLSDGRSFPVNAVLATTSGNDHTKVVGQEGTVEGPSSKVKTIGETAGMAGGGALIGLLFAHPLVGMAVGGTTGFVDRMRRRGDDLTLVQGTVLDYQLTRELAVR
ncbi:MAG TPA: hypothetical protein VG204_02045 [Terriglobia bacterium]|nr:hypothetical protein [Terriglobia bacterium]